MKPTVWVDIEADAFGISRRHEYEYKLSEYCWSYHTRLDLTLADLEKVINRIQKHAPCHNITICLGHHSNFRYSVFPQYKSNRRGIRRAAGYSDVRAWLQANYDTAVLPNVEADDVVGICYKAGDLIYSPDKDLRTIAGTHLQRDGEIDTVNQLEADRAFFKQILTGDSADGYPGCVGIGANAKLFEADKWLECRHEEEFWDFVLMQYEKARKKLLEKFDVMSPSKYALVMARCARILRVGEYDFSVEQPVLWKGPG